MNRNEKRAMVAIRPKTREKLMDLGKKGETYDDIINKLIKEHNTKTPSKRIPFTSKISREKK